MRESCGLVKKVEGITKLLQTYKLDLGRRLYNRNVVSLFKSAYDPEDSYRQTNLFCSLYLDVT